MLRRGPISALDRKLIRDLVRIWPQALAIALVLASGVATLILAIGAYRSLDETRAAYYERQQFAHVFARVTRAPRSVAALVEAVPGVATTETRIVKSALLDLAHLHEPATGIVISVPDHTGQRLNRLHLRQGRMPEPGRAHEVVVNEAFALASGFTIGSMKSLTRPTMVWDMTSAGSALSSLG